MARWRLGIQSDKEVSMGVAGWGSYSINFLCDAGALRFRDSANLQFAAQIGALLLGLQARCLAGCTNVGGGLRSRLQCVEDRRVPLLDVGSRQDLLMLQPVDRHAIGLQDAEGVGLVEHRQQVHHSVGNL